MPDWKDVLIELAKKLTPPFAFAILLLIVLAYLGAQISDDYIPLVYAVSLSMPVSWAIVKIIETLRKSKTIGGDKNEQSSQAEIGGDVSGTVVQGNRNIIQNIVHNYAANGDKSQKEELQAQLFAYLNWVQESFGSITLRGIEQEGRQVVTLPLETVYVPLQAEASPDEDEFAEAGSPEKMRQRTEEKRGTEKIKLNQVLGVGKRVIITGGPGSGKTTVLQHIAWTLARAIQLGNAKLAREKLGFDSLPLPIYVPLSLYAAYRRDLPKNAGGKQKSLATFISDYLLQRQMHLDLSADFLAALLREGRDVILLLDGLDEVPNEDERAHTRQSIEDLVAGRENLRVLVTSRVAAYRGNAVLGRGFRNIRVLPLNAENVAELVTRAYRSIYKQSDIQARDKARDLLTDIQRLESERRERLGEGTEAFVDSPLMVRMLLIVHFNNRRLPDQRADLYQKAVDAMLCPDYNLDQNVSDEIERRVAGSLAMNREMLQYLAYHMHGQGKEQGREIEEAALRRVLESEPTYAPFVDELIGQTRQRGTLLEERGGLYRFIHLSFQEFLAGRYFVEVVRDIETIAAQIESGLSVDSWWREPILLTVGYLDLTAPLMARRLLLRLSGADDGCAARDRKMSLDQCLSVAELAANAYLKCKSQQPDVGEKLKTRLLDLHKRGQDEPWTPIRMVGAADMVDKLGYFPDDLYQFIEIGNENGKFNIPNSLFFISKFPITNAQYARFLTPANFENKNLWCDFPKFDNDGQPIQETFGEEGWKWVQSQRKKYRLDISERPIFLPKYWLDSRFNNIRSNAPVVGITWWEANAYCRWLLQSWNEVEEGMLYPTKPKLVRLPTENEWVRAAGGSENHRFAFGELQDPEREVLRFINARENKIQSTTPVWLYPNGKSSLGLMDMSGNIFEWQANYRDRNQTVMTLRGGSWLNTYNSARISYSFNNIPKASDNYIGFRVLALPS